METMFITLGAVLYFGIVGFGLALGAVLILLYQIPSEMRKFRESVTTASKPLEEALAAAAKAQEEAALRTRQYSHLVRAVESTQPAEPMPQTWRRNRQAVREESEDWQPDWMAQQQSQQQNPQQ